MKLIALLLTGLLALAACSGGAEGDATQEASDDVDAWCATLDVRPNVEMDPSDPASVEAAFAFNLEQAQERAANAPAEIADAAQAMVEETERFIGILESVGWDLTATGDEAAFPPEAQAASDAITDFEVANCGVEDPRG